MGTKLSDTIGISVQDVNKTIGNEYAIVTRVNTNQTVNLKPVNDDKESDELKNIPVLVNLDLTRGDNVLLTYLDNNPNYPLVIGMKNPKLSGEGGGSPITPSQILEAILSLDGPNSGLDADKLDGYHYNDILSLINAKLDSSLYTASDILNKLLTVDGSGSGLDADKLDGHEASEFLLNNGYTAADILSKLLTVDGSGSGLDADLLDGYHIGMGNATISSVTANTIGTINITISAQPSMYRIWAFTHGGTHGTIQLNGINGNTFTFQYKFEATTTNRSINYIYLY